MSNESQYEKGLSDDDQDLRLVENVQKNTYHYIDLFSRAVDDLMPKESKDITYAGSAMVQRVRANRAQVQR